MANQNFLSTEQIAAELRVDVNTIRAAFRTGSLPGRKVGHGWVTTRAALERWIEGGSDPMGIETPTVAIESKERPT